MMNIERKKIKPERFQIEEEVVKRQIERIRDTVMHERPVKERMKISTRTRLEAEARGFWGRLKDATSEAFEPIWEKKEEILIALATKIVTAWIERQLNKHNNK